MSERADSKLLEAADWLLRLTEGADGAQIEAWRQWLAASPQNRAAFERAQEVWDLAPRIANAPWPTDLEVQTDGLERPARKTAGRLAMAAALAVAAIGAGFTLWQAGHEPKSNALVTLIGESRNFTLADGSQVTLGGASTLRTDFSAAHRGLELESGEAYFQVRRDAARPFTVRAGAAKITALGTAFNVRRAADRVEVSVTEGLVKMGETRLSAGRQAVIETGSPPIAVPVDVAAVLARRDGRLQYTAEPLRYVVADLNRYSHRPITLDDERAGDLRVTGTVLEQDLTGWLQGLEQALPIQVLQDGDVIRLRSR